MGGTGLHLTKDCGDGAQRCRAHGVAEVLECRLLGIGTFGPQEGHPQGQLDGQTGGHNLAEQPGHRLLAQRAGVGLADPAQHLRLALGAVEVIAVPGFTLDPGHLFCHPGTLAD